MSVSAETYIVISLMFAVFAAVAAVGTSVVLGAGFERLRAGFEVVRRQSGFFADAIYKLDQRTAALEGDTTKLKAGIVRMEERVDRADKTATFVADSINAIEQRILSGSPARPEESASRLHAVRTVSRTGSVNVEQGPWIKLPVSDGPASVRKAAEAGLYRDFPEEAPFNGDFRDGSREIMEENHDNPGGFTTLLSRYFTGESSGRDSGIVYH